MDDIARKLVVEIIGDASSLEKSYKRAAKDTTHFGREIGRASRGAAAGSGVFRGLGRSIAFASGGFLAFASATHFLTESIGAARDAAVSQRSLAAQMKASGESFQAHRDQVEKVSLSYGKFGFENDEVIKSLTVLDRATGNINKSMRLQGLVAGIARVKNIDLAAAAAVVGKVFGGQETALRRAVPGLSKNAKGMDLIREAQKKLAGQAAANTTAAERFHAVLHNTQEIIGTALLPTLNKYLNALAGWLQKMNESGQLQRDIKKATDLLASAFAAAKAVLTPLVKAFQLLADIVGSNKDAIILLVAAYATFKTAQIAGGIGRMAAEMGILSGSADATAASFGMKAGIAGAVVLAGYELSRFIRKIPGWDNAMQTLGSSAYDAATKFHAFGLTDPTEQFSGQLDPGQAQARFLRRRARRLERGGMSAQEAADQLVKQHPLLAVHDAQVFAAVTAAKQTIQGLVGTAFKAVNDAVGAAFDDLQKKFKPPATTAVAAISKERRDALLDLLGFRVDQAAATKGFADDLKALRRLQDFLKKQIALHKTNLDLQKQLFAVQQQIAGVLAQQAQQRADRARQRAERRRAVQEAAQFGLLGLGPGGAALVPAVNLLRRRLTGLREAVKGTFLDTDKTKGLLANIQTILSGKLGQVSQTVRQKIAEILANMRQQLQKSGVDVTRFQKTARGQFVLAGAHPQGGIVINGGVHLHGVQDMKALENAMAKRAKQRAHARRSTR